MYVHVAILNVTALYNHDRIHFKVLTLCLELYCGYLHYPLHQHTLHHQEVHLCLSIHLHEQHYVVHPTIQAYSTCNNVIQRPQVQD